MRYLYFAVVSSGTLCFNICHVHVIHSTIIISIFQICTYIASADFPFINIMFTNSFFSDKFVNPDCIKGIILTDKDGKEHCALKEPPGQFYFYSHRRQSFRQPLHIAYDI